MNWINPVIGKAPSSPEILAAVENYSEGMVHVVEEALEGRSFLVGDQLTMADLFVVAAIARGYQFVSQSPLSVTEALVDTDDLKVFTKKWAAAHPNIHEYYMRIKGNDIYRKIDGDPYVLDEVGGKPS